MTKLLKTTLILAICGAFVGWAGVCIATDIFTDNFDAYSTGNIVGQGSWIRDSGNTNWAQIFNDNYVSYPNSLYLPHTEINTQNSVSKSFDEVCEGSIEFKFKMVNSVGGNQDEISVALYETNVPSVVSRFYIGGDNLEVRGRVSSGDGNYIILGTIENDIWYKFGSEWDCIEKKVRYNFNENGWSEWYNSSMNSSDPANLIVIYHQFKATGGQNDFYIDDIKEYYYTPAVYLTTPVSGSTITDDSTELVGGWTNIDSTTWTNIKISFNDYQITESSGVVNVPITDDYGTFEIPLSDFNIPHNGGWTLATIVENNYEYNFDISNPSYALIFDVEGWEVPYEFTDFETWYDENVEDFDDPSVWAVNLTGFLNPVFEKIGQFGNRINVYLNISDAYAKGVQIGAVFPVIGAYIEKIDLFFGGFPIVQFFKWGILIMVGLFAVKIILKLLAFIPFIGGGG